MRHFQQDAASGLHEDYKRCKAFFVSLGMMVGDGGRWLRQQFIIMAQNTYTPITFWQDMTLSQFRQWIRDNNQLSEERKRKK